MQKGMSILWIVYFHLFRDTQPSPAVDPIAPDLVGRLLAACSDVRAIDRIACLARGTASAVTLCGFHAVHVFLVIAGFGLARSLGEAASPSGGWIAWYRKRLLRLYPMYWAAHLILLVSLLRRVYDPIDYRFLISLTGLRVWPIDTIHLYFNPAWWYFTLLVELYAAFPVLWWLRTRLGPTGLAALTLAGTAATRWICYFVLPVSSHWAEGALFLGRMSEFGLGMAVGVWHRRDALATESRLFHAPLVVAGAAIYLVGLASYRSAIGYCFTDALIGYGLFAVTANVARLVAESRFLLRLFATVGAYSYGLYLLHQPYVMYAGPRFASFATPVYALAATALVATLTLGSMAIERAVARITERVLG